MIHASRETNEIGPDRGIVFQSPCLLPWMSAFENVMLGVNQVYFTATKRERRELAEYYLSVVGLGNAAAAAGEHRPRHRPPHSSWRVSRQAVAGASRPESNLQGRVIPTITPANHSYIILPSARYL